MIRILVFCKLVAFVSVRSNTITSPQIRILDVATKASETRLIPQRIENRNFQPNFHHYEDVQRPFKSYVIYDDFPFRIFKEWKANSPQIIADRQRVPFLEVKRQPEAEWMPDYYYQNGHQILPPPKPALAYRSVYSNIIKVFDDSSDAFNRNRYPSNKYFRPDDRYWEYPSGGDEESFYPPNIVKRPFENQKYPENYPKVFLPNEKFHFKDEIPQPPKFLYPQEGFYDTYTINYNQNDFKDDEVEVLQDGILKEKNKKRVYLCSFIKLNNKQFPKNGDPCGRSDSDPPLLSPDYPDFSHLPNDKIPLEHRRQHYQSKRIKRSLDTTERKKRSPEFSYWESPFSLPGYTSEYFDNDGYLSDYYRSRGSYNRNRNRNQNYRNRYYNGNRANYEEYDDDYQNDDSNRGLTSYLTNNGRRYKNRKNNNDDDDDDNNDDNNNDNNDNNRDYDSDEDSDRNNRRNNNNNNNNNNNDRRRNEDSRDRRRNNNNNNNYNNNNNNNNNGYNDDDDYRDRRNNNRQSNSRRNNNNNNNNNNKRYYNDRYDYNSNRNRYYGSSSSGGSYGNGGYFGNGYGSSYGGNGYGGSYGGNGYGSSYGGNGYGGYGYNGGYGGYGSGNGFSSF